MAEVHPFDSPEPDFNSSNNQGKIVAYLMEQEQKHKVELQALLAQLSDVRSELETQKYRNARLLAAKEKLESDLQQSQQENVARRATIVTISGDNQRLLKEVQDLRLEVARLKRQVEIYELALERAPKNED